MAVSYKKKQNTKKWIVRLICVFLAILLVGSSLAAIFGIF